MPNRIARILRPLSAPAIFLVVLFVIAGPTLAPSYNDCSQDQQANYSEDEQNSEAKQISTFVYCAGVFAEGNNGAITAVATIFLTLITGILAWLAREQSKTSYLQLRAYVMIENISLERIAAGQIPKITVTFTNFGKTPARNLRHSGSAAIQPYPHPPTGWPTATVKAAYAIDIGPGGKQTMPLEVDGVITAEAITHIRAGDTAIYAVAWIEYDDVFGRHTDDSFRLMCMGHIMFDDASMGPYNETVPT